MSNFGWGQCTTCEQERDGDAPAPAPPRIQRLPDVSNFGWGQRTAIDAPDAPAEREADRAAETSSPMTIREAAGGGEPSADLRTVLDSHAGRGDALPDTVRETLEPRFDADLSDVRVHAGGEAHRLATGLGAKAFTYGSDIYFREGAYDPASHEGRKTLAHEVAHTVQQASGRGRVQQQPTTAPAETPRPAAPASAPSPDIERLVREIYLALHGSGVAGLVGRHHQIVRRLLPHGGDEVVDTALTHLSEAPRPARALELLREHRAQLRDIVTAYHRDGRRDLAQDFQAQSPEPTFRAAAELILSVLTIPEELALALMDRAGVREGWGLVGLVLGGGFTPGGLRAMADMAAWAPFARVFSDEAALRVLHRASTDDLVKIYADASLMQRLRMALEPEALYEAERLLHPDDRETNYRAAVAYMRSAFVWYWDDDESRVYDTMLDLPREDRRRAYEELLPTFRSSLDAVERMRVLRIAFFSESTALATRLLALDEGEAVAAERTFERALTLLGEAEAAERALAEARHGEGEESSADEAHESMEQAEVTDGGLDEAALEALVEDARRLRNVLDRRGPEWLHRAIADDAQRRALARRLGLTVQLAVYELTHESGEAPAILDVLRPLSLTERRAVMENERARSVVDALTGTDWGAVHELTQDEMSEGTLSLASERALRSHMRGVDPTAALRAVLQLSASERQALWPYPRPEAPVFRELRAFYPHHAALFDEARQGRLTLNLGLYHAFGGPGGSHNARLLQLVLDQLSVEEQQLLQRGLWLRRSGTPPDGGAFDRRAVELYDMLIRRLDMEGLGGDERANVMRGIYAAPVLGDPTASGDDGRDAAEPTGTYEMRFEAGRYALVFVPTPEPEEAEPSAEALARADEAQREALAREAEDRRQLAMLFRFRVQDLAGRETGELGELVITEDESLWLAAQQFFVAYDRAMAAREAAGDSPAEAAGHISVLELAALRHMAEDVEAAFGSYVGALSQVGQIAASVASVVAALVVVAVTGGAGLPLATELLIGALGAAGASAVAATATRAVVEGEHLSSEEARSTALRAALEGALAAVGSTLARGFVHLVGRRIATAGAEVTAVATQATTRGGASRIAAGALEGAFDGFLSGFGASAVFSALDEHQWRRSLWQRIGEIGREALAQGLFDATVGAITGGVIEAPGALRTRHSADLPGGLRGERSAPRSAESPPALHEGATGRWVDTPHVDPLTARPLALGVQPPHTLYLAGNEIILCSYCGSLQRRIELMLQLLEPGHPARAELVSARRLAEEEGARIASMRSPQVRVAIDRGFADGLEHRLRAAIEGDPDVASMLHESFEDLNRRGETLVGAGSARDIAEARARRARTLYHALGERPHGYRPEADGDPLDWFVRRYQEGWVLEDGHWYRLDRPEGTRLPEAPVVRRARADGTPENDVELVGRLFDEELSEGSLLPYMEALDELGVIAQHTDVRARLVHEVHGRDLRITDRTTLTDIRQHIKNVYREQLVEGIIARGATPAASHGELLARTARMNNADRGSIAEMWYARVELAGRDIRP
ncbi:MAG: DUF4157 domain-containing protein, partial [Myxococcales bacterium]|nr:DUF4157 domain-containing protein [Myxococcales bacterium]